MHHFPFSLADLFVKAYAEKLRQRRKDSLRDLLITLAVLLCVIYLVTWIESDYIGWRPARIATFFAIFFAAIRIGRYLDLLSRIRRGVFGKKQREADALLYELDRQRNGGERPKGKLSIGSKAVFKAVRAHASKLPRPTTGLDFGTTVLIGGLCGVCPSSIIWVPLASEATKLPESDFLYGVMALMIALTLYGAARLNPR